jgi:L-ribulose-5-phosphate 3-epimerase
METISRRCFLEKSLVLGAAGVVAPSILNLSSAIAQPRVRPNNISLAQWALVGEMRAGEWTNLDFPRIAREVFDIDGIEFVNTLWEVPTVDYLNRLKNNADSHGVTMVLIMVDGEGEGCAATRKERRQFAINHRKWIDIAQYLGCHAIRTNCIGPKDVNREDALNWAEESYHMLLEYAIPANISVLIENHGGVSNDPDFMVELMKRVNNIHFGTLPDWRQPGMAFDNVEYLKKTLPWAGGMSYRNQPTEELTAKMIKMAVDAGYSGWYGIESGGRDEIRKGKQLLTKYLNLS